MAKPLERERQSDPRLPAVMQAIADFDLTQSSAWADLDALSSRTLIDDVEVEPEGIIIEGDRFRGLMNVYVVLQYGGSKDSFQTSDAFRALFEGHFSGSIAEIENVRVDTSPFFAGETP